MLRFRKERRSDRIPPQLGLSRVTCRGSLVSREAQVAAELRRESERRNGEPEGARVKPGGEDSSREGEGCACARFSPQLGPAALPRARRQLGPARRALPAGRGARALPSRAAPAAPPPRPVRPVAPRPLGCRRPGAEASQPQRGRFLTPSSPPGCPFHSVVGPAAPPAPGCRM